MKCRLEEICLFRMGKADVANLTTEIYILTENMLPNKSGIVNATSLPSVDLPQAYENGDVLVSNIRLYFKKIWKAKINGGCSNDVLVFAAKENTDSDFFTMFLRMMHSLYMQWLRQKERKCQEVTRNPLCNMKCLAML